MLGAGAFGQVVAARHKKENLPVCMRGLSMFTFKRCFLSSCNGR